MASITIIQPLRSSSQLLVAFGTRSPFLFITDAFPSPTTPNFHIDIDIMIVL
jgi:hypothetical protein